VDFDNIGHAFMTIFQIVTLDGWSQTIQYPIQDSVRIYMCMYMHMYVYVYVCIYVARDILPDPGLGGNRYVNVYVCIYGCVYIHTNILSTYIYIGGVLELDVLLN
jgi:hypothetical protein